MDLIEIQNLILSSIKEQQSEIKIYHPNAILTLFFRAILRAYMVNFAFSASEDYIKEKFSENLPYVNPEFSDFLLSLLNGYIHQARNLDSGQEEFRIDNYIESRIPSQWENDSSSFIREGISTFLKSTDILERWLKEITPLEWEGIAQALYRTAEHFEKFSWIKTKLEKINKQRLESEA